MCNVNSLPSRCCLPSLVCIQTRHAWETANKRAKTEGNACARERRKMCEIGLGSLLRSRENHRLCYRGDGGSWRAPSGFSFLSKGFFSLFKANRRCTSGGSSASSFHPPSVCTFFARKQNVGLWVFRLPPFLLSPLWRARKTHVSHGRVIRSTRNVESSVEMGLMGWSKRGREAKEHAGFGFLDSRLRNSGNRPSSHQFLNLFFHVAGERNENRMERRQQAFFFPPLSFSA